MNRKKVLLGIIMLLLALWLPAQVYAGDLYISSGSINMSGEVRTSEIRAFLMKHGLHTDNKVTQPEVRLSGPTTVTIDETYTVGRLYTAGYALTVKGSETAEFTVTGLYTNSGGTAGDITIESGKLVISSDLSLFTDRQGLYSIGVLRVHGGSLTVYVYRKDIPITYGIDVDSFVMTGGKVEVHAGGESTAGYAMDIYGDDVPSVISGGELIAEGRYAGLHLGEKADFSITGGSVKLSGGKERTVGVGIEGYGTRKLIVAGGMLNAEGGECGIRMICPHLYGKSYVYAKGGKYGIYADEIEVQDRAYLYAYGTEYGILTLTSGNGLTWKEPLYIKVPKGGEMKSDGWRRYVVNGDGNPASCVEIDYDMILDSVHVSASPATVVKGKESKVTCTSTFTGDIRADVIGIDWTVSGNQDAGTSINIRGVLTVAAGETADTLTVRGTAMMDKSKYGEVQIALKDPPATPTPDPIPDPIPTSIPSDEADKLKDEAGSHPVAEATVAALPVDASIGRIDAAVINTVAVFSKKQMKVTYTKLGGVTNYIVAYRTAGAKMWTYRTAGNATKILIGNLKKKALLEFRVAGYKNGRIGPWSNISYRWYTRVGGKVTGGKKQFKVTVQKLKGATGFQLQYALKKGMQPAKLKTVKGRTTVTIKKLKSGKTYYVRWRPYRTYKGKKYLGIYTGVKAVKVK